MNNKLKEYCKKASEVLLNCPKNTRIRIVSHYDADGITSAAILCKALHRMGYDFHATLMRNPFDKGLESVKKEENEIIIFSDMGSGQIDTIKKIGCKVIIIDHHQILREKTNKDIFQINANLFGINGNYEACGATLCYIFAKVLSPDNVDLVDLAVTGATGDKQYIGGFRGFNLDVINEGLNNGFLTKENSIKIPGSLSEGLFYSVDPYYSGISGYKKAIDNLLKKMDLDKDILYQDLSESQKKNLHSYLILRLLKKGCEQNILDTVIRERYTSETLFGCELERLADLIDACGKGGNRGLGLSLCLGDNKSFNDALMLEKDYKKFILDELIRLENEGFKELRSYRYFYSNESSIGGVIASIATNFILDSKKPLLSIVRNGDEIHVSCRGNQKLVKKGLDLGVAMKKAAEKLNGHGGGHKIASGATIDIKKEKEFLQIVDEIIYKQIGGVI